MSHSQVAPASRPSAVPHLLVHECDALKPVLLCFNSFFSDKDPTGVDSQVITGIKVFSIPLNHTEGVLNSPFCETKQNTTQILAVGKVSFH